MAANPKIAMAADSSATREDVANAYLVFLGSVPSPAVLDAHSDSMQHLLSSILTSNQFKDGTLRSVLLRDKFPDGTFAGNPTFLHIHWAQSRLPLDPDTQVIVGLCRSWASLLEAILSDHNIAQLGADLGASGVDELLRERIATDPQFDEQPALLGAVDSATTFEVRGWALDLCRKSPPLRVEIYADDIFLGTTLCDNPRPDVADLVGGDGRYGFSFKIAPAHRAAFQNGRSLRVVDAKSRAPIGAPTTVYEDAAQQLDGIAAARRELSQLRIAVQRLEVQLLDLSRMSSVPLEAYDEYWQRYYRPMPDVHAMQRRQAKAFRFQPTISVLIPTYNSDVRLLQLAIASVRNQSYEKWELIISDDGSPDPAAINVLKRRYRDDPRIHWRLDSTTGGIAANTNRALQLASGEYVAFLDHDDELSPDALFDVVAQLQDQRYQLLYSDEDRIEEDEVGNTVHHTAFFKPDFDPDLLLGINYICHLVVVARPLLEQVGGLRLGFDGAQDHDLLLRLTRHIEPKDIHHIPRVLYHWRVTPGSVSRTPEKEQSLRRAIVAAAADHLHKCNAKATVEMHEDPRGTARKFANRVRWLLPVPAPQVSVIIPTRDRLDLLRPCIESIQKHEHMYPGRVELIIVDNDSVEAQTRHYLARLGDRGVAKVTHHAGAFNWSAINNEAAELASGEVLVFLNNDTRILDGEWLQELVSQAIRPDVGAVGARLLYEDGTIQHAGVLLGVEGVAGHEALGESPGAGGYFGRTHLTHSASAVTAACMATRRQLFLELGGFDDIELRIAFNDVDYCLKVTAAGYRVIYTPFATLYHLESKSRGREVSPEQQARHKREAQAFRRRWGARCDVDPFFNPHFERYGRPMERLRVPPQLALEGIE